MKKQLMIAIFSVLILGAAAFAAGDTAIIATDITSVDAMVGSAAATQEGAPVLVTENGELSSDAENELANQSIKNVIIIGGPSVVKEATENKLKAAGYKVIRLWGIERTGTAVEVAKYFWPDGSACAVLVEDTKDSSADTRLETAASVFASQSNCTLIPIQSDDVPAEVLSLLKDMNVSEVTFVGRKVGQRIRDRLQIYTLNEIVGSDDDVEKSIQDTIINKTRPADRKIVIIAAPDWRHALGVAAHPNMHTVVRFVSSTDQVPAIADFIKSKNITDVKVVGAPALAQQVADALSAEGINVTKVSGVPGAVAKELWIRAKEKWLERKNAIDVKKIYKRMKIKEGLEKQLNETLEDLNEAEVELEDLESAANVTSVREKIEAAKAKIESVRTKIMGLELDDAKQLLAELKHDVKLKRWLERERINWNWRERLQNEENSFDSIEAAVKDEPEKLEAMYTSLRLKCNTTELETLVEKAKSLRAGIRNATDSGDYSRASELVEEVRDLTQTAMRLSRICEAKRVLPSVAKSITAEKTRKAGILVIEKPRIVRR